MRLDLPLGKKAQRLSGIGALVHSENLDFKGHRPSGWRGI